MDTDSEMNSFQKAISFAYKLFSRKNGSPLCCDSLNELKQCLNQVTKSDLNLDERLLENRKPEKNEPPVTYVKILENQLMTVAVFVLRQGRRLPLHDHPHMHGFLKVIHGDVTIKTYSPLTKSEYPIPTSLEERLEQKYGQQITVYPMRLEGEKVCLETDECSVITPDGKNIHEIYAQSGTAAFLDVLSPPYNNQSYSDRTSDCRQCSYYREIEIDKTDSSIRYLIKINAPSDYWCDEAKYCGPPLPILN